MDTDLESKIRTFWKFWNASKFFLHRRFLQYLLWIPILIKTVCRLINFFIYKVKRIIFLLLNSFLKESTTNHNYFPCDSVLLFFSTLPFWKNVKNEETLMACSYRHFSFPCISFCVEPAKDWITFPSTFPSQSTKYVLTYYFHFNKLYRIEILIQRFEDWRMDNTFFYLLRQKS